MFSPQIFKIPKLGNDICFIMMFFQIPVRKMSGENNHCHEENTGGGNLNPGPPPPGLNPRLIPDWFFNLGPGLKSIWVLDWSNLGPRLAIRVQSGTNPGPRLAIRDQSGTPQIASQIESWIDPRLIPDWFFNPGPPPGFKLPPPMWQCSHMQICKHEIHFHHNIPLTDRLFGRGNGRKN